MPHRGEVSSVSSGSSCAFCAVSASASMGNSSTTSKRVLAGGTLHADGAAHQVYDALGDSHAKAGALHLVGAGFFLAGKGFKKGLLELLAHADAVILHHKAVFGVMLGMGELIYIQPDVPPVGVYLTALERMFIST